MLHVLVLKSTILASFLFFKPRNLLEAILQHGDCCEEVALLRHMSAMLQARSHRRSFNCCCENWSDGSLQQLQGHR